MSSGLMLYSIDKVNATRLRVVLLTILCLVISFSWYQSWNTKDEAVGAVMYKLNKTEQTLEQTNKELEELKAKEAARVKKLNGVADFVQTVNKKLSRQQALHIAEYQIYYSDRFNTDLNVVLAITYRETHFRCDVVSYDNSSYGCMQINYEAWKQTYAGLSKKKLLDPQFNIALGNQMLSKHIDEYDGNVTKAIERYRGSIYPSTNIEYRQDVFAKAKYIQKYLNRVLTA